MAGSSPDPLGSLLQTRICGLRRADSSLRASRSSKARGGARSSCARLGGSELLVLATAPNDSAFWDTMTPDEEAFARMSLVSPIPVTVEEARSFQEHGALKLRALLGSEGVASLARMVEEELAGSASTLGKDGDFSRMKYDAGHTSSAVRQILASAELKRTISALIPARVLFTQGIGFELTPAKKGFDWHFEFLSFAYLRPTSRAYTLWIPLDRIDPAGQHGGMEYVPEDVYSGKDKLILSCRHVEEGPRIIDEVGGLEAYRNQMPCSAADRVILDRNRVELAFEPGDALLFNRYVWHKSCALEPGPMKRRRVFVLRLVEADAIYDGTFVKKLAEFSISYGNPNTKLDFALRFSDLRDGDKMLASRFCVDMI